MANVEDVTEEEEVRLTEAASRHDSEMEETLKMLSKRLALPEELLPSFMHEEKPLDALRIYQDHVILTLRKMQRKVEAEGWKGMKLEEQAVILIDVLRLYGQDEWTSEAIGILIDDITHDVAKPELAFYILSNPLRQLFTSSPHPMLNQETSRALSRPAGGRDGRSDFHESSSQLFKQLPSWGCYNVLAWSSSQLSSHQVEKHIGLILPPTLVLLDDWEPKWRERGIHVLASWIDKMPEVIMKRMGIDKLLLDSLLHTMDLHSNPPVRDILPVTMSLIDRTTEGKQRADRYEEVVEKGIISAWLYAPSGKDSRAVLVAIAQDLEILTEKLSISIIRWLKAIIPHLLEPLQYLPTSPNLPHFQANLSALLKLLVVARDTGRIPRWRGQILDVLSRLWLNLEDRGVEEPSARSSGITAPVKDLIINIFKEIESQCPSVKQDEYAKLQEMDNGAFAVLVQSTA